MNARDVYRILDRAGLTPPIHFNAAPLEWIAACNEIAEQAERDFQFGKYLPISPSKNETLDLTAWRNVFQKPESA